MNEQEVSRVLRSYSDAVCLRACVEAEIQAFPCSDKAFTMWQEKRRQKAVQRVIQAYTDLIGIIDSLEGIEAAVIRERYLHLDDHGRVRPWREVAGSLAYSVRTVQNVHEKVLEKIGEK